MPTFPEVFLHLCQVQNTGRIFRVTLYRPYPYQIIDFKGGRNLSKKACVSLDFVELIIKGVVLVKSELDINLVD